MAKKTHSFLGGEKIFLNKKSGVSHTYDCTGSEADYFDLDGLPEDHKRKSLDTFKVANNRCQSHGINVGFRYL